MQEEQSNGKAPLFTGDPFNRMVAIVSALITVFAAVIALLESDASAKTSQSLRQAQQYAIQSIGTQATGELQVNYAWSDAYRSWLEWNTSAVLSAEKGDSIGVERYTAVRDRAASLTPLLSEPYFDPDTNELPDIRAFEANTYLIEATILSERFLVASDISGELESKEKAYGAQLLLTAVALFIYGLASTIVGRVRWLFVALGTLIANIAIIWMVTVYTQPITNFPDEAIVAYAQGTGLAHQEDYVGAINAFDQAIGLVPNYANAFYARGNAYYASQAYESAAADYQATIDAGREDVNVYWNLGWMQYLTGQYDEALTTNTIAIAAAPDQAAIQFNQALVYLALGDLDTADTMFDTGIQTVATQIDAAKANGEEPPTTLWWYLGTAASDVDNLLNCMANQVCVESPPYQAIADTSDSTLTAVSDLRLKLKRVAVAFEYADLLPDIETVASGSTLNDVSFAFGVFNDDGLIVAYEPLDTVDTQLRFGTVNEQQGVSLDSNIALVGQEEARPLFILFDYNDIGSGELFAMKVYKDGRESPGLRLVENWTLGPNGGVVLPLTPSQQFNLTPGDYRVELYLGSDLVSENNFTIE